MDDEHVDPQNSDRHNSPKLKEKAGGGASFLASEGCLWNDKKYSDGGTVCDNKRRYECWNGKWVDIGNC